MTETGYTWSINAVGDGWSWALKDRDTGHMLTEGMAPNRAAAAALIVRAIARGMTTEVAHGLAA